ncbi:MAG: SAM-dependent methyltransferase [Flavobacteriales bacterium]
MFRLTYLGGVRKHPSMQLFVPYIQDKPMKIKALRSRLFTHLEGIPLISAVLALQKRDVLDIFNQQDRVTITDLSDRLKANEGYLNAGMRLMASQGWLVLDFEDGQPAYTITLKGKAAIKNLSVWQDLGNWIRVAKDFGEIGLEELGGLDSDMMLRLIQSISDGEPGLEIDSVENQMLAHREGLICSVLLVNIGMKGLLEGNDLVFPKDWGTFGLDTAVQSMFEHLNWVYPTTTGYRFTEEGDFFRKRASAYGVTVSYLQTFHWLEELMFGKGDVLWDNPIGAKEIHVDRKMNVWGSGGAHSTYFNKIDEIVIEIFNRPLEDQPKGIADMGCGNGALLAHLYDVVKEHTLRGRHLEEHPILMIGADFNEAALEVTAENLLATGMDFHCVFGDIGDPMGLSMTLHQEFDVDLKDMLSVRSFLDHNRVFVEPKGDFNKRDRHSTGAFSFRGRRLSCAQVEQNLYEHMKSWKPFVEKFGLLVIELHTIPPALACENLGRTTITAYDGTHGFTDQYIVEREVFLQLAEEAGLRPVPQFSSRFPNSDLATVSINLLKGDQ